jgi:hypothetical protein
MSDNVYLNRDKTAVVSEWDTGKKWQVSRAEAVKLGLLDSAEKPVQERRTGGVPEQVGPLAPKKQQRRRTKR